MNPQITPNAEQFAEIKRVIKMIPRNREDRAAVQNAYRLFIDRNQGHCAACAVGRLHMELMQMFTEYQSQWEEHLSNQHKEESNAPNNATTILKKAEKQIQDYATPTPFPYGKRDVQIQYGKRVHQLEIKGNEIFVNNKNKPWKTVDEFIKKHQGK